jgi:hypothetical protein
VNGAGDAVEPGTERGDDGRRRFGLGQRGEAAQVRIQQDGANGFADLAPQRSCENARGAAPAEIGFQRSGQRRARRQRGEWRCRETGGIVQPGRLFCRKRARPDPAEQRPIRSGADDVFMHGPACKRGQPALAGIAGQIRHPRGESRRRKSHRLDHLAVPGPPQPGAAGNDRVRHGERQRTAGERQAVPCQARPEFAEEPAGARRSAGGIDQPCQRRTQLHVPIMRQGGFLVIVGTW